MIDFFIICPTLFPSPSAFNSLIHLIMNVFEKVVLSTSLSSS